MAVLHTVVVCILQMDYDDEVEEPTSDMPGQRHSGTSRQKTRADHNRQQRKRSLEQAAQRREAIKKQRRDMDQLKLLQAEIAEQEAHIAARSIRRQVRDVQLSAACSKTHRCLTSGQHSQVHRAEKASEQAPRLGRRRFKAEPLQVLLSEDAEHGSLRQLKPAAALARDAFKSLQKHGLLEPQ